MNIQKRNIFKQIIGTSLLTLSLTAVADNAPTPPPSGANPPHDTVIVPRHEEAQPSAASPAGMEHETSAPTKDMLEEKSHWGKEEQAQAKNVPATPSAQSNLVPSKNMPITPEQPKPKNNPEKSKKGSSFKNFFSHGDKSSKGK